MGSFSKGAIEKHSSFTPSNLLFTVDEPPPSAQNARGDVERFAI
jgi:hypothetical protein